jgi:hypothetical protein
VALGLKTAEISQFKCVCMWIVPVGQIELPRALELSASIDINKAFAADLARERLIIDAYIAARHARSFKLSGG